MRKIYRLFLGFIVFLALSCTTTSNVRSTSSNKITLGANKVVYLNLPRDGRYQGTIYRGSAQTYQELLEISIENYVSKIVLGKEYETINECTNTAKNNNADYLLYSTIINWEDRATVWSGIADTLTIKIEIIELGIDKKIYEAELFGKGKNLTFSTGSPEDLLPELFEELIKNIF
ncbi:MAG: DUF4823 domain-containing protein [Fusobacteriaceae bacterium]|jgi:hypothetical protein|nr:DUF4823 domain-containing protein [Fusobacteriaceae bacterium]